VVCTCSFPPKTSTRRLNLCLMQGEKAIIGRAASIPYIITKPSLKYSTQPFQLLLPLIFIAGLVASLNGASLPNFNRRLTPRHSSLRILQSFCCSRLLRPLATLTNYLILPSFWVVKFYCAIAFCPCCLIRLELPTAILARSRARHSSSTYFGHNNIAKMRSSAMIEL